MDLLDVGSGLLEPLEQVGDVLHVEDEGVPLDLPHDFLPVAVDDLELHGLFGQVLTDVLEGEDRLQVEEHGLHLYPDVQGVTDVQHEGLPLDRVLLHKAHVRILADGLGFDGVVVQDELDVLDALALQDQHVAVLPGDQHEAEILPILLHLGEHVL